MICNKMPKISTDYSKTVIYRIFLDDFTYVGSTTNFVKRKHRHKDNCNDIKYCEIKLYKAINENGGWNCFKMLEIEKYPCYDKNEARTREQYWIDYYKSQLNSRKAKSTPEEYRKENIEKLKEYRKIYYEENKDKILDYQIKYTCENKEILQQKRKENFNKNKEIFIRRQKEYYESNKDIISEKRKLYAEKNSEKIRERRKQYGIEKMSCECGSIFRVADKSKHYKTNKHQLFISTKQSLKNGDSTDIMENVNELNKLWGDK